ncbi:MAG: sigma-70 family RNA polymerase sigma factor [Chloroflexi bacterium]|nr:sigma-70 family RNA polymerase sigma factor [Chloroflexota bacterium]
MRGDAGGEPELWPLARDGDAQAFAALFDLHRDRVFRHALRLLGSWPDAEDVAASTFLELFRCRDRVREIGGSVLPWLLVTTSNLSRNATRARRRHRDFLARLPRGSEAASADWPAAPDLDPELVRALRSLPEQDMALLGSRGASRNLTTLPSLLPCGTW